MQICVGLQSCHTYCKKDHVMEICCHALYRFGIYALPDNAKLTYVRMMDVLTYLNKLLANDALNDDLCNFQGVERILSHPAYEIVQQFQFDLDLIEVSNGFCFSISKREFVPNAIPASKNWQSLNLGRSLSTTVRHHLNLNPLKKTS